MKSRYMLLILLVVSITSCAPSIESIQKAIAQTQELWTEIPSNTAFPTYTSEPTIYVTKIITVEKLITQTSTPSPIYTPTETGTPTITPNIALTSTAKFFAKLKENKGDGFYLIGIDIAPGVWRSTGNSSNCYWSVTNKTGGIIDNHFGMAGGTAYIPSNGFQVEFNGCGVWEFLSD